MLILVQKENKLGQVHKFQDTYFESLMFFNFGMFIFKFIFTNINIFTNIFPCSFVNNFLFFILRLIISIGCSVKDLQNLLIQSFPLYTSCLFSMPLNIYICIYIYIYIYVYIYIYIYIYLG